MKKLNKKISMGVLVLGLVIGGGLGLSGGLVAHADAIDWKVKSGFFFP